MSYSIDTIQGLKRSPQVCLHEITVSADFSIFAGRVLLKRHGTNVSLPFSGQNNTVSSEYMWARRDD